MNTTNKHLCGVVVDSIYVDTVDERTYLFVFVHAAGKHLEQAALAMRSEPSSVL